MLAWALRTVDNGDKLGLCKIVPLLAQAVIVASMLKPLGCAHSATCIIALSLCTGCIPPLNSLLGVKLHS